LYLERINDLNGKLLLFIWVFETTGLSKNQKLVLKFLEVKPEMTTRELAELVFGKPVRYKTKEYASISRSLRSLEKQGRIKRVQVQLKWKLVKQKHFRWKNGKSIQYNLST
jgi:predicted transcriptional regulator